MDSEKCRFQFKSIYPFYDENGRTSRITRSRAFRIGLPSEIILYFRGVCCEADRNNNHKQKFRYRNTRIINAREQGSLRATRATNQRERQSNQAHQADQGSDSCQRI